VLCADDVYSTELGLIQGEEKGKDHLPKGRAPIYVLACISRSKMKSATKRKKREKRRSARAEQERNENGPRRLAVRESDCAASVGARV
jgi:hypothetical protein